MNTAIKPHIESMNPPEKDFGFTYFSHMISPFRPDACLILGYGEGTIGKLIRNIWGDCFTIGKIDLNFKNRECIDAREFIAGTDVGEWDYIVVDLWNGPKVCEFVYDSEFIKNLRKISSRMISLNVPIDDLERTFKQYTDNGFKYLRHDQIEANAVIFFSV